MFKTKSLIDLMKPKSLADLILLSTAVGLLLFYGSNWLIDTPLVDCLLRPGGNRWYLKTEPMRRFTIRAEQGSFDYDMLFEHYCSLEEAQSRYHELLANYRYVELYDHEEGQVVLKQ